MSKLIFDLDGVIITYDRNFAETYSVEFGVPVTEIYRFFSDDYPDCAIGQADLPKRIEKYISAWRWPGDADSLIQYWFDCQNTVDTRLVSLIRSAGSAGHECYVASDQDYMRSSYIRNMVDLDSIFAGCFFSCDLKATKTEPVFFEKVLDSLECTPEDVYFWDDNPQNVTVAKTLGIRAELYSGYKDFWPVFTSYFREVLQTREKDDQS